MLFAIVQILLVVAQIKATEIVDMGSIESFGIFAYGSVTNEGSSVLYGNIGLSDGTDLSGFGPGILSGSKYIGNCVTVQGLNDLNAAKVDAASRPLTYPMFTDGQDLGGMTLPPGVYGSPSSMYLTLDDLVLDAMNDPNAVWIFQIASAWIVANERVVRMINTAGGSTVNVWWNVGSSATYQINSVVIGVTMAYASVTAETGATTGALFAANGAVTLSSNTVTAYDTTAEVGAGCPTAGPSFAPSGPTIGPTLKPSVTPTIQPTPRPTAPTVSPTTSQPSVSFTPTGAPVNSTTHSSDSSKLSEKNKLITGLVVGIGGFLILLAICWCIFAGGAAGGAAAPAAAAPAAAAPATAPAVTYVPVSPV